MEFTKHARRRMQLRRVTPVEVAEALVNREVTRVSSEASDRTVVIGVTATGRRLKIVVAGDEGLVITVAVQGGRR